MSANTNCGVQTDPCRIVHAGFVSKHRGGFKIAWLLSPKRLSNISTELYQLHASMLAVIFGKQDQMIMQW